MHRIRVVPEQAEVRCRRPHLDESANRFPGIGDARRVAEDRYRPHPLDGWVDGNQFFDQIDVGPILQHGYRDHLDAHGLGDGKVPVIAGDRAQEFDAVLLLNPRPRRVHAAIQHGEGDDVVHQFQAGVVARDQVGHCDAEQFGEDSPQARQAVLATIVAGVGALRVAVVVSGQAQQLVRQVELLCGWFAAGEIQSQLHALKRRIILLMACV
ncbi:Uncharacterised protein [Mycobacterium tuberculosis]|uniref:Uncharacterized protein n=1 Tax=Mycobacterium tuberculosis TaxID=1773 RepID=A0A916LBA2_MYCTX|nr:Uncharacterised protein [Mycobacterium tuberculosis]COY28489.1 Uncharacterised protein [Mycobacterium tuberculosis]